MRNRPWLNACFAVVWGLGQGASASEPLTTKVEAVLRTPNFAHAHWGLLVVNANDGRVVFEKNSKQLFGPASVTKLFSTAAALVDLGADFRFQTPVVRRGEIGKDGTLKGDLILVGKGDLSLGGRTGPDGSLLFQDDDHTYSAGNNRSTLVPSDPLAGLDHLAREVEAAGVKVVTGEVLVDDRLFAPAESSGSGPTRVSPVLVNDNLIDVVATPAEKAGEPATVKLVPPSSYLAADCRVETAEPGTPATLVVKHVGPRRVTVVGKVPAGHNPIVRAHEVDSPASFARTLFIESLRKRGVRVAASPLADNPWSDLPTRETVAGLPKVAEYVSPKLPEYVRVILKVSHNLHASTLPLLLAARQGERTLAQGLRRQGEILKGLGIEPGTVSFGGGAGGARADLVTPHATVTLLRAMAKRPEFAAYEAALPVLGRDGTLSKAVAHDSPARGHVRAKTGTYWVDNGLNGKTVLTSKALAGYMETAAGQPLVFAFFLNNVPIEAAGLTVSEATAAAGRLLGSLCEVFYAQPEDATPRSEVPPPAPAAGAGPAR